MSEPGTTGANTGPSGTGGPVEAVLFDLDDTICKYRRSIDELVEHSFDAVGVEPFFTAAEYRERFGEYVHEYDDVDEIRERSFVSLAEEAGRGPDLAREMAAAYAAERRDQADVEFLPGAREAVETLCERYRAGLVTNGAPDMQSEKLRSLGIEGHFETVVHAGHETPAKPDPEPFEAAMEALGVSAERAVKVGNSLSTDVAGAHAAGVRSVWLEQDGVEVVDPEPHYRITRMDELLDEPWA
ncbi:HAD family hydrolase [Halomicrobium salinisoli]|uniref:HAD family hydrolase n=1 Tax=Halomicrobium salinisoli TaxID=2878391 RepID=UPI001CF030FD|nr:HAD family hydrolase [Halomicrobium salinisoli]